MVALKVDSRKANRLLDLKVARYSGVAPERIGRDVGWDSQLRQLATATGFDNTGLLKRMLAEGLHSRNLLALRYAPIAEIAWASGRVTPSEYVVAVKPMFSAELFESRDAVELFRSWLVRRPSGNLLAIWEDYVKTRQTLHYSTTERDFGRRLYELAEKIALASGGVMDQGDICPAERMVLERISRVYGLRAGRDL